MASKHQDEESRTISPASNDDDTEDDDDYNCSLCDDNSKLPAVNYCRNCGMLYCDSCQKTCHPPRGPLKRHIMISAERLRSEKVKAAVVKETPVAQRDPICEIHHEAFYLYCNTCLEMLCKSCWYQHKTHMLLDIPTACRQQKADLETKTRNCLDMKDKMAEIMNNLKSMMDGVQNTTVTSAEETQKTYNETLAALEAWREDSLKTVHDKYGNMQLECERAIERLKLQRAAVEMTKMHLTAQAENQINAEREAEIALQNSMAVAHPDQAEAAGGQEVSKPTLKFVHTACTDFVISENGALVEGRNTSFVQCDVQTDGRLQSGQHFWEMVLTVQGDITTEAGCDVRVGVTQESCQSAAQPCVPLWGIGLVNCLKLFKCLSLDEYTELEPSFKKWQVYTGTHRLGFYLDCISRTLIIIDCDASELIATVNDICVSKPLIPAIRITENVTVSASLLSLETSTLPLVLAETPEHQ